MADWKAPFHAPKFTEKQFEKRKAAYVAKHGYKVTIPSWKDIIVLGKFKSLTEQEAADWKAKRFEAFPADRLADIRAERARKKKKYLDILADPSPKIARNAAAILTSLDDIQDAVATLACVGMIAAAVIGGPVAFAILGPLGLILGASTLLNLINPMSHLRRLGGGIGAGRLAKIQLEMVTKHNPFSKRAKVKLAKKLKKFRPSVGNAIEALQVTAGVFGFGLCLGPIMGFIQATISGVIRTAIGQKVQWGEDPPKLSTPEAQASRAMIANCYFNGFIWDSDASDQTLSIMAGWLAMQVLYPSIAEENPIDMVDDIGSYLVEAPQPTDPLTIEILEEAGFDFEEGCTWPQNGKRWLSIADIQESTQAQATANLVHYAAENNHSLEAFIALTAADDFAMNFLASMEGPELIEVEYTPTNRIVLIILDNGFIYPEEIREDQISKFEDWIYTHEYMNTVPTWKDIQRYAETFCGFVFVRSPEERR